MATAIEELRARLGEIGDLSRAAALLAWDERTYMPAAGGEARSSQLATLAKVRHEMFCDDEVGRLLEAATAEVDGAGGGGAGGAGGAGGGGDRAPSIDADLVRVVARDWAKARRVPSELRAEMARASSAGEQAWVEAKRESDYSLLLPHLERNVELCRRYAELFDGFEDFSHPYDPLLDEYEPQMGTEAIRALLGELREGLVPLVAAAPARTAPGEGQGDAASRDCFRGEFPEPAQRELIGELIAELPFPEGAWRIDPTDHPFAITIGRGDVRMTTRYDEGNLGMALFSAMHEAGHALYEANQDPALSRTPLEKPRSLGLHESQSRLWENWVARGRPYLGHLLPRLRERFPAAFGAVDAGRLHRDANRVERSLIRIEADEVTYNLHILIRFELELEIFDGGLALSELPEAWNARYADYLGLEVPDDSRGVLQDVHWAGGAFGYFPTYSLGNVIAGQLWEAAASQLEGFEDRIGAGELAPLGEWLRERVHRWGRRLTPAQILAGAGCGELAVGPLLDHLQRRAGGG